MKRYLSLLLAVVFVLAFAVPSYAARPENKYQTTFNGRLVAFDVQPELVNSSTFVPFRAIFEKMGADIEWDGNTRTITAKRGSTTVKLNIGSTSASVNGQARTLAAAPYIKEDRTMIPLRFVGEAFGGAVNYNPQTTHISIIDNSWPKRGGTLNLALWNKPVGDFNPITNDDTYGSNIMGLMYDGLWRYDDKLQPQPSLAESWEWNDEYTKLTFHLRKDVTFHDGTPFTAKDVVFTYKAIWHPKYVGPRNTGWDAIKGYAEYTKGIKGETAANFEKGIVTATGIEGLYAPDDYTVVFELKQADAPFFTGQIVYPPVDSSKYGNLTVNLWGSGSDPFNAFPNGTGSFRMKEYVEGQYALLAAYDSYYGGRPYMDKILYRVVDSNVAVGEMQRGTLDYVEANPGEMKSYKAMNHVSVTEYPDFVYQQMYFNTMAWPFDDKRVRQAAAYAIDRQAIIDNLMEGHASSLYTPIHPLTWAFSEDVNTYAYNPAKAKQLLDEAGWKVGADGVRVKDGKRLSVELLYPNAGNQVRIRTAPVVQQWLNAVGFDVKLGGYDFGTIIDKVFTSFDFQLSFMGFSLSIDPDPTGVWDKGSYVPDGFNPTGWYTDRSEELIKAARATLDIEERMGLYAEWQKLWADDIPSYFFYAPNTIVASNKRLSGFRPGPQGDLWNLDDLWLADGK